MAKNKMGNKTHNRKKNYIINEGAPIPPLADMGIFTREGKVAAPMQHKFRQINRFLEMVDDVVTLRATSSVGQNGEAFSVLDFGCGKSYLTFVLYYYLNEVKNIKATITGLDLKADVIEKCAASARKYGYTGLTFEQGDIAQYATQGKKPADMVIALHACDTATDHALYHAVQMGAGIIMAAPCCQHELNAQMKTERHSDSGALSLLTRYGIVKERAAALMTDAVRANLLAYCGYTTKLMEFVDLAHTPKNLLIRAVKSGMPTKDRLMYLREAEDLCRVFRFEPTLYKLIMQNVPSGIV